MKNALILHGTSSNPTENWFAWLEMKLKAAGWKTWVPDLPLAEKPNVGRYYQFIFNNNWQFTSESILIGHSSGAVAILGILERLPADVQVDTCYLVGAFKDDLGWDSLRELFTKPYDFAKIKTKAKKFVFIHSDNDPHCPLAGAQFLATKLDGELLVQKGQQHFSVSTFGEAYRQFPFLLKLIEQTSQPQPESSN